MAPVYELSIAAAGAALGFGVITSISPCPLASNIAAISYIGRGIDSPRRVALSGLAYSLGRTLAYVALGGVVMAGLVSTPGLSSFLQVYMNQLVGPVLIVVGMVLCGILELNLSVGPSQGQAQRLADKGGLLGAGLMGMLFALAFCPVSAAYFFGGLIPLALNAKSIVILPSIYGVGTALPVVLFAFLVAVGASSISRVFQRLTAIERWSRLAAGVVFILVGIYYCLHYVFGLV